MCSSAGFATLTSTSSRTSLATPSTPVVPGHEIVGVVTDVGSGVTSFKPGHTVGVGYFVDSCRSCDSCSKGYESYCPAARGDVQRRGPGRRRRHHQGRLLRRPRRPPALRGAGGRHRVQPHGAVRPERAGEAPGRRRPRPPGRPLRQGVRDEGHRHQHVAGQAGRGPRPPRRRRVPGQPRPRADEGGGGHHGRRHIDTVSADHPVVPLLDLLKPMGQMVVVGLPTKPLQVTAFSLVAGGKRVAGSAGGGVGECQAMLDFAGEHGITADVEVVGMDYVNTAIQRLERNDVRYRFVVDVAGSKIGGVAA